MVPAAHRLPPAIIRRIVHLVIHRIWSSGGVEVRQNVIDYRRICAVCYAWRDWINEVHTHLDMLDLSQDEKRGAPDLLMMSQDLQGSKAAKCSYCRTTRTVPRKALSLRLNCLDGEGWRKGNAKKLNRYLELVYRQHHEVSQLQLDIADGRDVIVASSFPLLAKLLIRSANSHPEAILSIERKLTLASTLVRLDLAYVTVDSWSKSLPSVKVLTLDHLVFGRDDPQNGITGDLCRQFFASFPSLESIGFDGATRLVPASLAQLKVIGITSLHLGPCCFPTTIFKRCAHSDDGQTFVNSLARYFRCRIKHLFLPPNLCSLLPFYTLVTSRSPDKTCPPYLAKLETVRIAHSILPHGSNVLEVGEGPEYKKMLNAAGLGKVEVSRWDSPNIGRLSMWEPKNWT